MKYKAFLLLVLTFIVIFASCSNEEVKPTPNPVEEISDDDFEATMNRINTIKQYVSDSDNNISDLLSILRNLQFVNSVDTTNSIINIITSDGEIIKVDLTLEESPNIPSTDEISKFNNTIDSISALFTTEPHNSTVSIIDNAPTRSANYSRKYLSRRNILIFSCDPQFRKEDSTYVVNSIIKANRNLTSKEIFTYAFHDITEYTPNYFEMFSRFDIVVVGCHGNPNGEIYFPWTGMSKTQKKIYMSLSRRPYQTGVSLATKTIKTPQGSKEVSTGVLLGEKFFATYLGNLNSTIVWAVKCYAGKIMGEFRDACCNKKSALEYFGPTRKCYGPDVYKIFNSYLGYLSKGMESYTAFLNSPKEGASEKPLNTGGTYGCHKYSYAKYPKPEVTGVKISSYNNKVISRSMLSSVVDLGVRFRFTIDKKGKPVVPASGGIKITDKDTKEVTSYILSESNLEEFASQTIGDDFVIREYTIHVDNLRPNAEYSYCSFASDNDNIFESESIQFSTENSKLYIYTAEELAEFSYSVAHGIKYTNVDVELMADINMENNEYSYVYVWGSESTEAESGYNGTFNGNGHTVRWSRNKGWIRGYGDNVLYSCQSLLYLIGRKGVVRNLNMEIYVDKSQPELGDMDAAIAKSNYGTIEDCNLTLNLNCKGDTRFYGLIDSNYGTIRRCYAEGVADIYILSMIANNSNSEYYSGTALIEDCQYNIEAQVSKCFNGIGGNYKGVFRKCSGYGKVKLIPTKFSWGTDYIFGIGYCNEGTFVDCDNYCNLSQDGRQDNGQYVGNFYIAGIGSVHDGNLLRCNNHADLYSVYEQKYYSPYEFICPSSYLNTKNTYEMDLSISAIAAYNSGTLSDCHNFGYIKSDCNIIAGCVSHNRGTLINCANHALIEYFTLYNSMKECSRAHETELYPDHFCVHISQSCPLNFGTISNYSKQGTIKVSEGVKHTQDN